MSDSRTNLSPIIIDKSKTLTNITKSRTQSVKRNLSSLVSARYGLFLANSNTSGARQVVFGVHTGDVSGQKSHRQWRFPILNMPRFYGSYHEVWEEQESYFSLEEVALHIYYKHKADADFTLLAFHIEPRKYGNGKVYESSPHLHVNASPYPISRLHISLALEGLEETLKSLESIENIIKKAVDHIRTELCRFPEKEYAIDELIDFLTKSV